LLSFEENNEGVFLSDTKYPMKLRLICLFVILLSLSCKKDNALTFEPITYSGDECGDCPKIKITVPKALGKSRVNYVINTAVQEEIIYVLNFDEDTNATDIKSAMHSFVSGYNNLKNQFAEETTPWEANVSAQVSYEDKKVLTIKLDSYLFTGGAHGYNTTHYLNFDKVKAIELDSDELFKNITAFEEYAETKFRIQEGIPAEKDINSTGFMFETGSFYLAENIGYTKEGLQLFYEQYEIASYADGPIILTLPYPELQNYLVHFPKQK